MKRSTLLCLASLLLTASVSPAADLRTVAQMVEAGRLGPAERELRRLLAQGGGAAARSLLGVVLARQGRVQEAERELKLALAANPSLVDARQHLARLLLSQKREEEAIAELRQAARLGPLERDLGLKLAAVELAQGRPTAAERQLRSVADRFKSVQALLQLARLQSGRNDIAGALESLRRARAIAPNSEEVLSASADASLAARSLLPAIRVLDSLTRLCPTVARYHHQQGVALLQVGDTEGAVASLREAERLEPNQPPTLIALSTALNRRALYSEAKPLLLRAQSLAPDDADAMAALAEAEEGLGEWEAAEAHAQRALVRSSAHASANLVLGRLRMRQGRYAEARDALMKAAAADPTSPLPHDALSLAYARLDDTAGAQKHRELSRQKAKQTERRVQEVRGVTGGPRP